MSRKIIAIPALVLILAGCGTYADTASDTVAVHETGSMFIPTDRVIVKDCVGASKNQRIGYGDTAYYYPAGVRTWDFSDEESADHGPLYVAVDQQRIAVSGTLSFTLKTDCETLNAFHAKQGRKNWVGGKPAYINDGFDGWAAMLDTLIGVPVQTTLSAEAETLDVLPLYQTDAARQELARDVLAALPAEVTDVAGGDFFTFTGLQIKSAIPPQATLDALDRQATAVQNKLAAEAENETNKQRYDTVKDCIDTGLSEQTCVLLYGINSGKVPYLAPEGAVVVPPSGS